jgi:hypothetical protein
MTYDNCFSLGFWCGTAASLSRIGLREQSGPFDWYYSDYMGVLSQIENGFQDFMVKDNLKVEEDNKRIFIDIKYGFRFPHDIYDNFEREYESIQKKYKHRAERFLEAIQNPTVFFRCVKDQEEIDYINRNWEYADYILKRYNPYNRIIYMFRSDLTDITENVESYRLNISLYRGTQYELRHMFETSEELLDLLSIGLIERDKIKKNLEFDRISIQRKGVWYINRYLNEDMDGLDNVILSYLGALRYEGIYLWGAVNMEDYWPSIFAREML